MEALNFMGANKAKNEASFARLSFGMSAMAVEPSLDARAYSVENSEIGLSRVFGKST